MRKLLIAVLLAGALVVPAFTHAQEPETDPIDPGQSLLDQERAVACATAAYASNGATQLGSCMCDTANGWQVYKETFLAGTCYAYYACGGVNPPRPTTFCTVITPPSGLATVTCR